MKVNGLKIKTFVMVAVSRSGSTALATKATGRTTRQTVEAA